MLSGCLMAPMALVGPASHQDFHSFNYTQSGINTTANHIVKKSTGKTINLNMLLFCCRRKIK